MSRRDGMRSRSLPNNRNYHPNPERQRPSANNKTWIRDVIRDSPSVTSEYVLVTFINSFRNFMDGSDYDVLRERLVIEGKVYVEDVKLIMKYLSSIQVPQNTSQLFKVFIKTRLTCEAMAESRKDIFKACSTTNEHVSGKILKH